jgi:hypothetical protein
LEMADTVENLEVKEEETKQASEVYFKFNDF